MAGQGHGGCHQEAEGGKRRTLAAGDRRVPAELGEAREAAAAAAAGEAAKDPRAGARAARAAAAGAYTRPLFWLNLSRF